mgnify:CR=1 FL=1
MSAFSASGSILSGSDVLPNLRGLMALMISVLVDVEVL